jgi:hypothetical protein
MAKGFGVSGLTRLSDSPMADRMRRVATWS